MLDHQSDGTGGAEGASSQNDGRKTNTISDVENQLGFLLVGFGAVLSFLGIRSSEVTTVLRNDGAQASLIALLLLLGVLAAVLAVVVPNSDTRKVSRLSVVGIILVLFGVGALVVRGIPISAAPGIPPGIPSKTFGLILVLLGIINLVISRISNRRPRDTKMAQAEEKIAKAEEKTAKAEEDTAQADAKIAQTEEHELRRKRRWLALSEERMTRAEEKTAKAEERLAWAEEKAARAEEKTARAEEKTARAEEKTARAEEKIQEPLKWYKWLLAPCIPLTVVSLLTSVMFIAISAYGGMRLESDSQLSSSVQVAASVETTNTGAMISAHVTASKIEDGSWVGIDVVGLPSTVKMEVECNKRKSLVSSHYATCLEDPCANGPDYLGSRCKIVMGGTVVPDANGDVDETLNAPISSGEFQDIDVRAYICSQRTGCQSVNNAGYNSSRLDIIMPTPSAS